MLVIKVRDPETGEDQGWRVVKQGDDMHQQILPKWLHQMEMESPGFVTQTEDAFIMDTVDGEKVFRILEVPGSYCVHCGERIEDARTTGAASRKHVAELHADAPQNETYPAGFRIRNSFLTILEG